MPTPTSPMRSISDSTQPMNPSYSTCRLPAPAAPQGSVGNGAAGGQANANYGVPNQGPAVVPPLPSPVTVR